MPYYDNIALPAMLARKVEIQFWEFELALDVRPTLSYPEFTIPELHDYALRMSFSHSDHSEQYYAAHMQLMVQLEEAATAAETDQELAFLSKHLPSFYIRAHDILSEKIRSRSEPDRLKQHKRLAVEDNAVELARINVCETAEEAFRIATRHSFMESPRYDTYTEAAFLKAIELADDIETLKEINQRSLPWHQSKFAALRKMLELPPEKRPSFP